MRPNKSTQNSQKKEFIKAEQNPEHVLPKEHISSGGFDYQTIQGVRDNPNVTPEFIEVVEVISERIGAKPQHLLKVISFETGGTFSPSIQNGNGAVGLIQFLPNAANVLGTSIDDLRQMTALEQLKYVSKYFESFGETFDTVEKIHKAIILGTPKKNQTNTPKEWRTIYYYGGIRAVQQKLMDKNFVRVNQRAGFVNGMWTEETATAIANFQEANDLPATGNFDEETGQELFKL